MVRKTSVNGFCFPNFLSKLGETSVTFMLWCMLNLIEVLSVPEN